MCVQHLHFHQFSWHLISFRAVRKSLILNDSLTNKLPGTQFGAHICWPEKTVSVTLGTQGNYHAAADSLVIGTWWS